MKRKTLGQKLRLDKETLQKLGGKSLEGARGGLQYVDDGPSNPVTVCECVTFDCFP